MNSYKNLSRYKLAAFAIGAYLAELKNIAAHDCSKADEINTSKVTL